MRDYAYRRGNKFFCSWTCLRAYDSMLEDKKRFKQIADKFYRLGTLGERLKLLRKFKGVKLSTAALRSGVPEASLANYENNRSKKPMFENLRKLADYYGVKVKDLVINDD